MMIDRMIHAFKVGKILQVCKLNLGYIAYVLIFIAKGIYMIIDKGIHALKAGKKSKVRMRKLGYKVYVSIFMSSIYFIVYYSTQLESTLNIDSSNEVFTVQVDGFNMNQTREKKYADQNNKLLSCNDIRNLQIIRLIGKGVQKAVYEVKLPWGEHAVVKRCISHTCVKDQLIEKEGFFFNNLHHQYGDEAIDFFGACNASKDGIEKNMTSVQASGKKYFLNYLDPQIVTNFSVGYTMVMELATPLLSTWNVLKDGKARYCFSKYFTTADLEALRTVARQYANYSESPLILYPDAKQASKTSTKKGKTVGIGNTDNYYAEQYIISKAGLRHGDLDQITKCKNCTYESALELNCRVLSRLVNINLNCTLAHSQEIFTHFPFQDVHINSTEAVKYCT